MRDRLLDRGEDRIGCAGQPVVHPQTVLPRFDKAGAPEVREVTRRLGLRDAQALVDVAHTDLAGQQQTENPEPRAVTERLEDPLHLNEGLAHIFVLTDASTTG